ncbi:hypothetical protein HY639_05280 [Candidatus Woesearchaeota archaeon]|nr:hypothetical protein [Candidatus Woesearchaeota archaeon]
MNETAFQDWYLRHYKAMMVIPILLLLLSIGQIAWQTYTTGDFIKKSVSLKGGISVSLLGDIDEQAVGEELQKSFPAADIDVRILAQAGTKSGIEVEIDLDVSNEANVASFKSALLRAVPGLKKETLDENLKIRSPVLGKSFFNTAMKTLLFSFILMGVVVTLNFRTFVPSVAVVLAAFSDIIGTVAFMNIADMRLSTSGIAALLMLIGYSVDTDILLTMKVLGRQGARAMDMVTRAMKTGLMMTATTIIACLVSIMFIISLDIKQIMIIILVGLIIDIINTWIQNVGILLLYLEKKGEL